VQRYLAHGLVIDSDIPLPFAPARASGAADVAIRRGPDGLIGPEPPEANQLAAFEDEQRRTRYTISRDGQRIVLRYPGICVFTGDAQLRRICVTLEAGADAGLLTVLASGAVLAVHLMLAGELVLHASAVRVGDHAIAFVGASGMGKSTLATLYGQAGYELIADDVLRVGPAATAYPGGMETRLRQGASDLARGATGSVRKTADGRLALRLPSYTGMPLPLAGCILPYPSRSHDEAETRVLGPSQALRRLLGFPRIVGWTDPAWHATHFSGLADLVAHVPVIEAVVPWGPPFRADLSERLLDRLEPALSKGRQPLCDVSPGLERPGLRLEDATKGGDR
jgi:hypothetical protein